MSSNYKILLYFLKTFNHSLRIGMGLRNRSIDQLVRKDFFEQMKCVNKNCQTFESFGNNCKQNLEQKTRNSRNVRIFSLVLHFLTEI